MATEHPDDIVHLAQAANPVEARIWQQALEDEGIRAKVVGDYLEAGIGNVPGIGPEIWVHKDDLARAAEILQRGQEKADEPEEEAEE